MFLYMNLPVFMLKSSKQIIKTIYRLQLPMIINQFLSIAYEKKKKRIINVFGLFFIVMHKMKMKTRLHKYDKMSR